MITPATSHWLTVLRNHSCNFSPYCEYGSCRENPSRADVDDIGGMVHLEYIVNFVVNRFGEPLRAFCGHRLLAHRSGIAFGDREVWSGDRAEGRPDHRHPGSEPGPGSPRPSPLEQAAIGTRARWEGPGRDPGTLVFIGHPAGGRGAAGGAQPAGWSHRSTLGLGAGEGFLD